LFIVQFENFRLYVRAHVGSKTETIFFHHQDYLELPNFAGSRSAIGSLFALHFKAAIRLVNIGKRENMASEKRTDSSPDDAGKLLKKKKFISKSLELITHKSASTLLNRTRENVMLSAPCAICTSLSRARAPTSDNKTRKRSKALFLESQSAAGETQGYG